MKVKIQKGCLAKGLLTLDLIKAPHIGVREARAKFEKIISSNQIHVVTVYGKPKMVLIPYERMLAALQEVCS